MQALAREHPPAEEATSATPQRLQGDPAERLRTLRSLLDRGLITRDDFDGRKKEILSEI